MVINFRPAGIVIYFPAGLFSIILNGVHILAFQFPAGRMIFFHAFVSIFFTNVAKFYPHGTMV